MKRWVRENENLFIILLFTGFTTCIYAPYEMYLNNVQEFWFEVVHFWWIPLICIDS